MKSSTSLPNQRGHAPPAESFLPEEYPAAAREYAGLVYGVALRSVGCPATAQEVTQDVFLLLSRKEGAISPGNLGGWLHRTAVLKSRERLRSEARYRRRLTEYARQQSAAEDSRPAEAAAQSVLDHLDNALDQLEDADRRVIFLRYFEGLDAQQMGERLGISTEAAQKQCERARARLAKKLAAAGILTAGMLHAELTASPSQTAVSAAAAGLRGEASASPPLPATLYKWLIAGGVAGALVMTWLAVSSQHRAPSSGAMRNASPDAPLPRHGHLQPSAPAAAAKPGARRAQRPDYAEIAALLEQADEGDTAAASAAENALTECAPGTLLAAAGGIREMPLPVNQLRVLALGIVRHLVSRDPKTAVLAGERLWRAQHGSSAPILASLVNEALARWHRTEPTAAAEWWKSASTENILEDRGTGPPESGGFDEHAFLQARQLESTARDTSARLALALRWQENENSSADPLPPWPVMSDVLAHKLTTAQSAELADALDAHPDIPEARAFEFRLALAQLPTTAPSVETLRRTATRAGVSGPDPDEAAAILSAWSQRDPAGIAAWLATINDTADGAWIADLYPASQ